VPPSEGGLHRRLHVSRFPATAVANRRRSGQTRPGAEADRHQVEDRSPNGGGDSQKQRQVKRCESASVRRFDPVSGQGNQQRTDGGNSTGGRLRDMVAFGGVLLAVGERKLGNRRWRGTHQPGNPPGGHAAVPLRSGGRCNGATGVSCSPSHVRTAPCQGQDRRCVCCPQDSCRVRRKTKACRQYRRKSSRRSFVYSVQLPSILWMQ